MGGACVASHDAATHGMDGVQTNVYVQIDTQMAECWKEGTGEESRRTSGNYRDSGEPSSSCPFQKCRVCHAPVFRVGLSWLLPLRADRRNFFFFCFLYKECKSEKTFSTVSMGCGGLQNV